jgi:hypothetical protein
MGTSSKRAGPRDHTRAVERSPGHCDTLAQPEKRQDCEDDHDEANEIDDTVHMHPFRMGSRIKSRTPRITHDQC